MRIATGLDLMVRHDFAQLRGQTIAVLCNQASVDHDYTHLLEHLLPLHGSGFLRLAGVFGPQHGLFGHQQDNMIEWEGGSDSPLGVPVHSLYGEHRQPSPEMLAGVETLVVDLPDVGARYYTFAWTMALCLEACSKLGIRVFVLDRPNPINGTDVEGTVQQPGFESFVGLHPLPMRHGITIGEIANHLKQVYYPKLDLQIHSMQGWYRGETIDLSDAPWTMPSPNMPTVDTAMVYPGACLLEGTNLSEGRGTTRPFEIFGAPFLNGSRLAEDLHSQGLPGVRFQPYRFEPTFNKHAREVCEGCYLHVVDREAFLPVLTTVAILQAIVRQTGLVTTHHSALTLREQSGGSTESGLAWLQPPYEYVTDRMPFDILAGNEWLREAISNLTPLSDIRLRMMEECSSFDTRRSDAMLYDLN